MRNVRTIRVCDFGHPADIEAAETISFRWRALTGELDLCAPHAKEADKLLAPVIAALVAQKPPSRAARKARRTAAGRQRTRDVRTWLRDHGHPVPDRGRLPADLVALYDAAQ